MNQAKLFLGLIFLFLCLPASAHGIEAIGSVIAYFLVLSIGLGLTFGVLANVYKKLKRLKLSYLIFGYYFFGLLISFIAIPELDVLKLVALIQTIGLTLLVPAYVFSNFIYLKLNDVD